MKDKLVKLLDNAYAPYSNYRVACIVKMRDGKEFAGVNVENASYGGTICAERNAINSAVTNGYKKGDFESLHVMNATTKIGSPCFICRQTMSEFFDEDTKIFVYNVNGEYDELKVSDIIVRPFNSDNLKGVR